MWSIKCGMEVGWALGGLGNQSHPPPVPEAKGAEDVGGAAALPARGTGVSISSVKTTLSYRQAGGRTVSLGHAQSSSASSSKATFPADLFKRNGPMGGGGEAD